MAAELSNWRYTAMFVPPVAPSKAWTTKIVGFAVDCRVKLASPAIPDAQGAR